MEAKKVIGMNLTRFLRRSGMTQRELSQRLGVSTAAVSSWCGGQKAPRVDKVDAMAELLGVGRLDFYREPEEQAVPPGFEPLPPMKKVPLIGSIACGQPITAEENIEGYVDVPERLHCDFSLRCNGDSMIGAGISDGDIVYIRSQPEVENGQIAAVRIGDEATLKRVYHVKNGLQLLSENPKYPPMMFTLGECGVIRILGLAVGFTGRL
jgi:repressor LexA